MLKVVILLGLLSLLASCGQHSEIKASIQAERLGDGSSLPFNIVLPLSEDQIAEYKSDTNDVMPVLKGVIGSIMNLGASLGAGKQRLTITQPLPEIPEGISSIKIKRIFFYMDTVAAMEVLKKKMEAENKKKKIDEEDIEQDFNFLRRLSVKISSVKIDNPKNSLMPIFDTDGLKGKESSFLARATQKADDILKGEQGEERRSQSQVLAWDKDSKGLLLFQYHQKSAASSIQSKNDVGPMTIIQTGNPGDSRSYLKNNYKDFYNRLYKLNNSIILELPTNPADQEVFKNRLSTDASYMDELKIGDIIKCQTNCLDLKIPNVNLIELLKSGNAIKVDAYIDPQKAPKSFQLKGFLEFEVRYKTNI